MRRGPEHHRHPARGRDRRRARRAAVAAPRIAHAVAVAQLLYANEVDGGRVHTDLRLIAGDQAFLGDLASGNLEGAQTEALRVMTTEGARHITRVSVVDGARVLVNAVLNYNGAFVVAPLEQQLNLHGRSLGTLLVSVQDVVGYIKLIHVDTGAYALVRGSSGQMRTTLPAAARVALPSAGSVTIAGRSYRARSFRARGWKAEALTVWVLVPE